MRELTNQIAAVETKGFTKPNQGRGKADTTVAYDGETLKFPSWTTKEPLEQADIRHATTATPFAPPLIMKGGRQRGATSGR